MNMGDCLRNGRLRGALARLLLGATTIVFSHTARADNLLGLYIGGGVGQSHVRSDLGAFSNLGEFVENHTGWKALIGVRPISLLGAELEYADLGHSASGVGPVPPGLVYRPLPLPIFDVYGKAGFSRLRTEVNASWRCVAPITCVANPSFHQDSTDTRFAYGAGAQAKFLSLGVRVEYERISEPGGSPDLYSIIATWTF